MFFMWNFVFYDDSKNWVKASASYLRFVLCSQICALNCVISGNAINHLANHLKNLKSFLWKYGGKMDQVDSFRISEEDLAKVLNFRYHAVHGFRDLLCFVA